MEKRRKRKERERKKERKNERNKGREGERNHKFCVILSSIYTIYRLQKRKTAIL